MSAAEITNVAEIAEVPRRVGRAGERLLDVRGLQTSFHTRDGVVRAVTGVDFHVDRGEILGLVGESGCGKTRQRACPSWAWSRRPVGWRRGRSCSTTWTSGRSAPNSCARCAGRGSA